MPTKISRKICCECFNRMNFHPAVMQSSTFLAIITSIPAVWFVIMVFFVTDLSPYDEQTARYTYSAIFQGFAAILAVSLTVVLIVLHYISNTIFNIEERIYEIIGKRVPKHIPISIESEETYVRHMFYHDMLKTQQDTKITPSTCSEIENEVLDLFRKRDVHICNRSSILRRFKLILPMTIIVMSLGLISLVSATPGGESVHIAYLVYLYLILGISLCVTIWLAWFFYSIASRWNHP